MAVEAALSILRAGDRATLAPAIVISGPHAFLREYVFDTVRRRMLQQGMKYRGFQVGGAEGFDSVLAELREADLFCFPTYYENENQPVNLIEAMAFGLPILTTRWRSLPELFTGDYPGLVDIRSPEQIANVMPALMAGEAGDGFRELFLRHYTLEHHLSALAQAFHDAEKATAASVPAPGGALQAVQSRQ